MGSKMPFSRGVTGDHEALEQLRRINTKRQKHSKHLGIGTPSRTDAAA